MTSDDESRNDFWAVSSRSNIEHFQDRSCHLVASLDIELLRAKRYGRPFSLVTLSALSSRGGGAHGKDLRQLNLEKRMRRIAPKILRLPDFWGRIDRLGFLIALPETRLAGAQGAIDRMVTVEGFQQMVAEFSGRSFVALGAAEFGPDIKTIDAFVTAAKRNVVWTSAAPHEESAETG